MTDTLLYTAQADFHAARRLPLAPDLSGRQRLHGHNFRASLRAQPPERLAQFAGEETDALARLLARAVEPLDYQLLNELLEHPTDAALARWLQRRLNLPHVDALGLRSTETQGLRLDARGEVQHWRRYRFEAAHFLPNVLPGHKCGRLHGHGFEVALHVAEGDPAAVDLAAYDALDRAWAPLQAQLQHRCLNDIDGLENPTAELLTSWIWAQLLPTLPTLRRVSCYETPTSGAHYDGAQYRIWKAFTFDSALRLRRAPAGDPRARVHGHTYTLRLHLAAVLDTLLGWIVDFGDVKRLFEPVYRDLDHHPLHERGDLTDVDAATLAHWIRAEAAQRLPALARVDLDETPGCGVVLTV